MRKRLHVVALIAALGCGGGGAGGDAGPAGTGGAMAGCTSALACTRLEDCPAVSCTCPGIRFPVRIQRCLGSCCAATCAEACPQPSGTGGAGGSGGTGGDGGTGGTGGMIACPVGAYDIDVDWMTPDRQGVGIVGSIFTPADVGAGQATELSVEKAGPDAGGTQLIHALMTQAGRSTITYRIKMVPDGNYYLRFGVDQGGNGAFGDPGDLDGFYNGTVTTPITGKAFAPLVIVRGACQSDRDFGVAVLP